jgi:hypothetical protein
VRPCGRCSCSSAGTAAEPAPAPADGTDLLLVGARIDPVSARTESLYGEMSELGLGIRRAVARRWDLVALLSYAERTSDEPCVGCAPGAEVPCRLRAGALELGARFLALRWRSLGLYGGAGAVLMQSREIRCWGATGPGTWPRVSVASGDAGLLLRAGVSWEPSGRRPGLGLELLHRHLPERYRAEGALPSCSLASNGIRLLVSFRL